MIEVKSEIQVRELFFKYAEKLGFTIIESRTRFPDYILKGKSGNIYRAEVEYDLANFVRHNHDPHRVDFIIFWEDLLREIPESYVNRYGCPLWLGSLINLKKELTKLGVI